MMTVIEKYVQVPLAGSVLPLCTVERGWSWNRYCVLCISFVKVVRQIFVEAMEIRFTSSKVLEDYDVVRRSRRPYDGSLEPRS